MKITEVRVWPVLIPRMTRLTTSYGARDDAATIVTEVRTDDGLVGIGQSAVDAPFYGEHAEAIIANVQHHLAPVVVGESPMNIEHLVRKMRQTAPHAWSSHAAIELALWDLKGKALGVPVYQLLGGKVRDGIDLMGFVRRSNPDKMAKDADATLKETPYPVLKMKIGIDPKEDVAQYRAVAEAVRGRAVVQVDGNAGYTIAQAIPALQQMYDAGSLGIIEQPVARVADLAEIARRIPVPVMADEAIYPYEDAIEVVQHRAASVALMKITKHGGILTVQKIASVFDAAGLTIGVAIYYDIIAAAAAHVAAATPCCKWPSPPTDMQDTILKTPMSWSGLKMPVPEGPGFGVELDPDKMRKYAVGYK